MEFTINCTRVPIPRGTTLYGTPLDICPAPDSDHNTHTSVLNDGGTSNLSRWVSLDGEESGHTLLTSKSQIVSCKKQAIISSFNARTLGPPDRLEELAECSTS